MTDITLNTHPVDIEIIFDYFAMSAKIKHIFIHTKIIFMLLPLNLIEFQGIHQDVIMVVNIPVI
ncbi:MAG: hypothetical protein HRU25_07480 [Psychrobium sp.]|nr:hypothetical protein [Psychrobium sp.]